MLTRATLCMLAAATRWADSCTALRPECSAVHAVLHCPWSRGIVPYAPNTVPTVEHRNSAASAEATHLPCSSQRAQQAIEVSYSVCLANYIP